MRDRRDPGRRADHERHLDRHRVQRIGRAPVLGRHERGEDLPGQRTGWHREHPGGYRDRGQRGIGQVRRGDPERGGAESADRHHRTQAVPVESPADQR